MTQEAFDNQELTPNGYQLLRHVGEFVRSQTQPAIDPCASPVYIVADASTRDVQSAEAFAQGYFPAECAGRVPVAEVAAGSALEAAANDHVSVGGCFAPDEEVAEQQFGGNFGALDELYRPQLQRLTALLGCCSAEACAHYALPPNCSLEQLPWQYNGVYFNGYYSGPLQVGGALSEALLLQAASGVSPVAWGEVDEPELIELYELHERVMWFGSNLNASRSYGSSGLAYALTSLEQLVTGVAYAGVEQPVGASLLLAIFAHDFNLLYMRKLLRVQWLTPSWPFNAASTGAHIAFELWRTSAEGAKPEDAYEVVARYVAANLTQQGSNLPLTPPHAPPGTSELLREPCAT